jgi:hypothetical protein
MRRPCVFVSSTCYDLRQVRADMRQFLEELGLDPLLSESNSFPVNPDVGAVDNCLEVVQERADIFVLVVGGRYGSTTDTGKSVTNLEFLGARAKGVPVYVFVIRAILDVLPVWKANPLADFSNVTDSPKLFDFVAGLKEGGEVWVFPFDVAQDIFDVLRTQLAYLFMDALELRTKAYRTGGLSPAFRDLDGILLRLIIQRPRFWEYSLFSEALEGELRRLADVKRDWQYGLVMGNGTVMTPSQFSSWMHTKFSEASRIAANMTSVIHQALPVGLGPPGVSGDPEAILYAANRLATAYRTALEWKLDFRRIELPEEMENLRSIAERMCDNVISEVEEFSHTVKSSLTSAIQAAQTGVQAKVEITLRLTVPDQSELQPEMDRLTSLIRSGALHWK